MSTQPSYWRCPLCHTALHLVQRSYQCANQHHYDQAKEGYVNLLLVNRRNSSDPGDNKAQLLSRRAFLQRGFYAPLAAALSHHISEYYPDGSEPLTILDAGCGEGYYLNQLAQSLGEQHHYLGTDISREAARLSAKQYRHMQFAVASSFDLPLADQSVDGVIRVFAPASESEIKRVLKPKGLYLWVYPAPQHLYELRQLIYDNPQLHQEVTAPPETLSLFSQQSTQSIHYPLHLPDSESVAALLSMTPYYWAASREKQEYCQQLPELSVTVDFCLAIFSH